jgi:hypothetical protein
VCTCEWAGTCACVCVGGGAGGRAWAVGRGKICPAGLPRIACARASGRLRSMSKTRARSQPASLTSASGPHASSSTADRRPARSAVRAARPGGRPRAARAAASMRAAAAGARRESGKKREGVAGAGRTAVARPTTPAGRARRAGRSAHAGVGNGRAWGVGGKAGCCFARLANAEKRFSPDDGDDTVGDGCSFPPFLYSLAICAHAPTTELSPSSFRQSHHHHHAPSLPSSLLTPPPPSHPHCPLPQSPPHG